MSELPETMLRRVDFDLTDDDEELERVEWVAVDESEDDGW